MDLLTTFKNSLSPEETKLFDKWSVSKMPEPCFKIAKGHKIIPEFSAESAENAFDKMDYRDGDIFVVSYPKTGTIWLGEVIRQIFYHDDQNVVEFIRQLHPNLLMVESGEDKKFSLMSKLPLKRRTVLTHLPSELLNVEKMRQKNAKVVYVYRNPKDEMVSWFKFLQGLPSANVEPYKSMLEGGWNKYFEHTIAGDFWMNMEAGKWYPDHILSWYPYRDNKNVYFVCFEDMKINLSHEIKKLSEFLDSPVDDETAKKLADVCSFINMKKAAEKVEALHPTHVRKGKVGGWKEYFTVSQSELIDKIMEEKLKDTDIKFKYE